MRLSPGSRIGQYEVLAPLGAGRMGEVYRARDSRLGRDVALKVLPEHLARDAQRLARFEREARVLASINHSNIATLYGVEDSSGHPALVMELVEGETLDDRLHSGGTQARPLPTGEAIAIARQIAAALEGAHERGIIHRDLKPANVVLRPDGTVKVLDFGLAKALEADQVADPASATITANVLPGAVLGTPAYMSPEQARGLAIDKRTDIWAFGCVLYEMLTGKRAFPGEHASDVMAKVIEREPDYSALPDEVSQSLRRLLRKCLEKDPRRRLRDMGDALLELEVEDEQAAVEQPGLRRARVIAVLAIAAALTLAAAAAWWVGRPEIPAQPILFTMPLPPGYALDGAPVPSPTGDRFVFVARSASGESALWLRSMDSPMVSRIEGTEGALGPFWSPDGRSVGFGTRGSLKRVDVDGGPVQIIAPLSIPFTGATWNADDVIVFAPSNRSPLHRVPAGGGVPVPVTALDATRGENSHRYPHFLPDGRHFLFTARAGLREQTAIFVGSLEPGKPQRLLSAQSQAIYVPTGHLLFARDGTLLAQRFDVTRLALSGDARTVYGGIPQRTQGALAAFAVSADGRVLAWGADIPRELTWFDRNGTKLGVVASSANYDQLRLAPDGKRAAVAMVDGSTGNYDIWVVELDTGTLTRVTSHPAAETFPVWSPKGTELLFASERDDRPGFYRSLATGAGAEQLALEIPPRELYQAFPTDWSADGRFAVFHSYPQARNSGGGVWLLPLEGERTPAAIVQGPFMEWIGSLSPDGKWLAYMSDETGIDEVYVRSLSTAQRYRISTGGGIQPRWRRDGKELFFVSLDNRLMSVSLTLAPEFAHAPPRPLFAGCGTITLAWMFHYDVSADGSRSLWLCPADDGVSSATVAVNWASALEARR